MPRREGGGRGGGRREGRDPSLQVKGPVFWPNFYHELVSLDQKSPKNEGNPQVM